jgi:WD40 repeat protein
VRLRPLYGDIPVSCATYANPNSGSSFIIGSTRGLFLIDKEGSGISELLVRNSGMGQKDILAVEYSKDGPFVVLSGDRKGVLQFLDVRCPTKAASIIQHASSVCHIKHVRDGIIAVSGLKSTLCNYDQRFLKNRPLSESWPEIRYGNSQQTLNATAPAFTYTEHENDAWTEAGFDIDADAGIAAAAQTGTSTAIKIFSLKTGKLLRSVDPTGVGHTAEPDLARVVKFVPNPFGSVGRDLWVAKGSRIVSYVW